MCQGFSNIFMVLDHFVLTKLATSGKRFKTFFPFKKYIVHIGGAKVALNLQTSRLELKVHFLC